MNKYIEKVAKATTKNIKPTMARFIFNEQVEDYTDKYDPNLENFENDYPWEDSLNDNQEFRNLFYGVEPLTKGGASCV